MKRNALLIGGFVLVAIALAVAGVLWLNGNDLFTRKVDAVIYYQGNVNGLVVGAPVTFRGVPVGQVESISIEVDGKTLAARIPVHVRLHPGALRFRGGNPLPDQSRLAEAVQRGLRAKLVAQSFVTGQKNIELDMLPDKPATLYGQPGESEIPAVADRIGALVDQVADLPIRETVQEAREVLKQLRGTLNSVQSALDGTQAVLHEAAKEVKDTGAVSRTTLSAATAAIERAQGDAGQTLQAITQLADATRTTVDGIAPDLRATIAGAREAAEAARVAAARIAELTAPNAPLRGDLDASLRDLAQAARAIRDWSELIEEKPNAVIFGKQKR